MNTPIIINAKEKDLDTLKKTYPKAVVIDSYAEQLEDLFLIRNPHYKFLPDHKADLAKFIQEHSGGKDLNSSGNWVYFPWNDILVHYLVDSEHQEIRTARNKNLITKEEQDKFYDFSVGVAGLSVGSHGALTLALMGGARKIKLADPDVVSPTNLNRMRFDFSQVGKKKVDLVAQYIYQLNPYAEIHVFSDGITSDNMADFLDGLNILVEELDDIDTKVAMRVEAKKRKMPVIMATDNADSVIIDIERFDLHPDLPIFDDALKGMDMQEVKASPLKMFEAMAKIIDVSLVPPRVLLSVLEVGKKIYSWPQLATAATLSGTVIAYVVRKIALGEPIKEGKHEINVDEALDPDYEKHRPARTRVLENFLKEIGLDDQKSLWIK